MSPPAAVYVVVAVVGVAAIYAFKELVYEPHLAPTIEAWAEDFLERRRASRNRRASAVPVRASRRRDSPPSSVSSFHDDDPQRDREEDDRAHGSNNFPVDEFELEALASKEVDEWRNEVLRSQQRTKDGLRKRRTDRLRDEFDSFDIMSTTVDESFTSLTHTTHVISNLSSPITPSTVSLPQTPTHHLRSESQLTTRDAAISFIDPHSPRFPVHDMPAMSPRERSPVSTSQTPRPPTEVDTVSPSTTAIPPDFLSLVTEGAPRPLPFTPTYQVVADDSPFGPLLPDTPRSSAEIYGGRPFSPITRVMGSPSGVSTAGSKGALSSRANSTSSIRTRGSSSVPEMPSGLASEVVANSPDNSDNEDQAHTSMPAFIVASPSPGMNGSVISSLSERYPTAPTPPVIVSPPASSIGVISMPSSPRSGGSEVMVHHDAIATDQHFAAQTRVSLPLLQLPPESSLSPRLMSRAQSSAHSATSPALSCASFLSPMPMSRAASESEGDEFLSIASDDSDWNASPVTPGGHTGPVHDRLNNPFLDFEHLTHNARANGSEHGDGSEGSEVLIADLGREGASEVGSDESWGSARRH